MLADPRTLEWENLDGGLTGPTRIDVHGAVSSAREETTVTEEAHKFEGSSKCRDRASRADCDWFQGRQDIGQIQLAAQGARVIPGCQDRGIYW